ncbi:hypothetical protein BJ742DRAFT_492742 [Cladochytrium replicatum]|nr:hypothetical protein BJ742DRAFT_492742 [Cladochytrium replicatum]
MNPPQSSFSSSLPSSSAPSELSMSSNSFSHSLLSRPSRMSLYDSLEDSDPFRLLSSSTSSSQPTAADMLSAYLSSPQSSNLLPPPPPPQAHHSLFPSHAYLDTFHNQRPASSSTSASLSAISPLTTLPSSNFDDFAAHSSRLAFVDEQSDTLAPLASQQRLQLLPTSRASNTAFPIGANGGTASGFNFDPFGNSFPSVVGSSASSFGSPPSKPLSLPNPSQSSAALLNLHGRVSPTSLLQQQQLLQQHYAQQQQQQQQQQLQQLRQIQAERLLQQQQQQTAVPRRHSMYEQEDLYGSFGMFGDSKSLNTVPPPGYICKLCLVEGHWLKNCTMYRERRRDSTSSTISLHQHQQVQSYLAALGLTASAAANPAALHAAAAAAARYNAAAMSTMAGRPLATKTTVPPEGYVCRRCGVVGHWVQNCPTQGVKMSVPPDTYVCKICNVKGHWIQQCPNRSNRAVPMFM